MMMMKFIIIQWQVKKTENKIKGFSFFHLVESSNFTYIKYCVLFFPKKKIVLTPFVFNILMNEKHQSSSSVIYPLFIFFFKKRLCRFVVVVGGCWFRKKTKQEVHYSRCFWPVYMDVVVVCMNLLLLLLFWCGWFDSNFMCDICVCVWIPLIVRIFCGLFIFKISISFKHHIIFNNNCACHCVCECFLFFLKKKPMMMMMMA